MKRDETGKSIQNWDAEPKRTVILSLTKTAWQILEQQAFADNISRSELVEHYARSLVSASPLINNLDKSDRQLQELQPSKRPYFPQASQTFAAAHLDLQTVLNNITRLASEFRGDVCVLNMLSEDGQWLNSALRRSPVI